jgi:hypothetical protein
MLGLKKNIAAAIEERIKRLEAVCLKIPATGRQKPELYERWPELNDSFQIHQEKEGDPGLRDEFLDGVSRGISTIGKDYVAVIQGLAAADSENGIGWLQGIVDGVTAEAQRIMPSLA